MKKMLLSTAILCFAVATHAQTNKDQKTIKETATSQLNVSGMKKAKEGKSWVVGGSYSINAGLTNLSNWSGGGSNSVSAHTFANVYANYQKGKSSWVNSLNAQYGYLKTQEALGKKTADLIEIGSLYGRNINPKLDASALLKVRTQLSETKIYNNTNTEVIGYNSRFFAPAYLTLAPGITWKPHNTLKIFFSPAASRGLFVMDEKLSNEGAFGITKGKKFEYQIGSYLTASYKTNIAPSITYTGNIELYSNYLKSPENMYIFMTNTLAAKISKNISATWNLNLAYDHYYRPDPTKGPQLQTQSILGAGLLYNF